MAFFFFYVDSFLLGSASIAWKRRMRKGGGWVEFETSVDSLPCFFEYVLRGIYAASHVFGKAPTEIYLVDPIPN